MPTCFISYSWDSDKHKSWVKSLATKLRADGIETILDQWHLEYGEQLPHFMEKSISTNDYVLVICTPKYKEKSDARIGGVGYEGDIITAELLSDRNTKKFIPVLRSGDKSTAIPVWLNGHYYVNLSGNLDSNIEYKDLSSTMLGSREKAPPVGENKSDIKLTPQTEHRSLSYIQITGVIVDEVTMPKNDGTPGSALYKVPFKLSRPPSALWKDIFIKTWNCPPRFSTMHRPGIASVHNDKIILDGTTIDEVKIVHRETLILVINETNRLEKELLRKQAIETEQKQKAIEEHKNHVSNIVNDLDF
jgi:ribosomal protein L36